MKVKFKGNIEPCIQYEVKNSTPIIVYDEVFEKNMECIEIEILGLVPLNLLVETNHEDNTNAIDIAVYLTNEER